MLEGNIWYTGNDNGTVGKLDPDTGEITVYPMPDPGCSRSAYGHLHANGDYWFSCRTAT